MVAPVGGTRPELAAAFWLLEPSPDCADIKFVNKAPARRTCDSIERETTLRLSRFESSSDESAPPIPLSNTKASGVGAHLPPGLGVGLSEAAGAVRGGQRRGGLAGPAMVR